MGEQLDQHANAAREPWFGAKAAANYLGLHRSTLFLAVQRKHLIPDHFTPGGHARFRPATLEAFRNRIANEAATSETPLYAPVHTLADLAHAINKVAPFPNPTKLIRDKGISDEVKDVCTAAVEAISAAPLQIPQCLIALRVVDQYDPFAMRMVAQRGVTSRFLHDYMLLRSQPNTWFATMDALETRDPVFCEDTADISLLHNGSMALIQQHHIRSYAIFPIVGKDMALGVLLLISDEPRTYTAHEVTFLCGVADQIATAVTNQSRADRGSAYAKAGRELTQLALSVRAQATTPTDTATTPTRDALRQLRDIFLTGTDAADVCTLGFEPDASPSACAKLYELTRGALTASANDASQSLPHDVAASGADAAGGATEASGATEVKVNGPEGYVTCAWMSQGSPVCALAISVPLDGQRRAAVGAMWRRATWSDDDHLLLVTLAGACAMMALGA